MSIPFVAHVADQKTLHWIRGGTVSVLLSSDATDGQLSVLRSRLPAGSAVPVHVHSEEDEICMLLEGTGVFWVGHERHDLKAGDVISLPRNVPHAYRLTSDGADILTLCTPAGIEKFFESAGWDVTEPTPDDWALTPEALTIAAIRYGQRILGPPLSADDSMPAKFVSM